MTRPADAPPRQARRSGLRLASRLGLLLAAAAVLSAVLVTGVAAGLGHRSLTELADATADDATGELITAAAQAYTRAGNWHGADLGGVAAVAAARHAGILLTDTAGHELLRVAAPPERELARRHQPVRVDGRPVATAEVTVGVQAQSTSERALAGHLLTAALIGLGAAVLIVTAASTLVARRVTRPLATLAAAAERIGAGAPPPPLPTAEGGAEIETLSHAIARMHQRLQRSAAWRAELLADVAHELRTPMAVLQAELEGLADGVQPATPETLRGLHEEVIHLTRLVNDLQALASAESATLDLHRTRVDAGDIAAQACRAHQQSAALAGVALTLSQQPAALHADPVRLRQILDNLISNAVRYTSAGGRARVEVRPLGHGVLIRVADSGRGIAEADQARVFTRFYRSDTTRSPAGSGVGLAVVARLVAAHGGTIGLDSRLGEGTRVSVWLPADTPRPG